MFVMVTKSEIGSSHQRIRERGRTVVTETPPIALSALSTTGREALR